MAPVATAAETRLEPSSTIGSISVSNHDHPKKQDSKSTAIGLLLSIVDARVPNNAQMMPKGGGSAV